MSGLPIDDVIAEMEKCYQILKESKKFGSANGMQSLSHVLSVELGNSEEKCSRVIGIHEGLKEKKKKYGQTYELSTLGSIEAAALSGIVAIIIAQEAALIAAITASTVATTTN